MTKRKSKKTRAKPVRVFSTSKRRGKNIYDVKITNAHRTRDDLNKLIDKAKLSIPSDLVEGGQVKITLVSKRYSNGASISLLHDIDTKQDLRESIQYTVDHIFRKLRPGDTGGKNANKPNYLRPGNPMNNYINRITIDFETND